VKKVHLALGATMAAGVALAMPAATANAATTTTKPVGTQPHRVLTTATPFHVGGAAVPFRVPGNVPATAATCPLVNSNGQLSTRGLFFGAIGFDGECVGVQTALLQREQTGLTERVQYYTSGELTHTARLPGLISAGYTYFASYPNRNATEVCQALVANGTSTVKYGPVCEYTSI
jgi:hypothetical protein